MQIILNEDDTRGLKQGDGLDTCHLIITNVKTDQEF